MALIEHERWERRADLYARTDTDLFDGIVRPGSGRGRMGARLHLFGVRGHLWGGEMADQEERDCREVDGGWEFDEAPGRRLRIQQVPRIGDFVPEFGALKQTLVLEHKPGLFPPWVMLLALPTSCRLVYQPPLTEAERAGNDAVGPSHRPDWCVGSYSVLDGTGVKVAHVPRPLATDGNGRRCWLDLQVERRAHGFWTCVRLPNSDRARDWWRDAVTPIQVDPNMGYTSVGGSTTNLSADYVELLGPYAATGNAADIYYYAYNNPARPTTLGIYDSSGSLVEDTGEVSSATSAGWFSASLDSSAALSADTVYWLAEDHDDGILTQYYDADRLHAFALGASTYSSGTLPASPTLTSSGADREYSIYATYTSTGGGGGGRRTRARYHGV